ncbi:MAG: fibronectin type III domain-containing protein [Syntrophobacteraceae bacterium]
MRSANTSPRVYSLLSLICAICAFQFFPIAAQAQTYSFSGTWNYNDFITGPGSPWWERGTLTVTQSGTFTGSGTESTGASDSPSGSFTVSSSGIVMALNGQFSNGLCMSDSTNSMLTCTATLPNGSSDLIILSQQSTSTSLANLAGTWQGSVLSSGPTASWAKVSQTINANGTFTGTYTKSDGTTSSTSGTLSITPLGVVTCASGACLDSTFASVINPAATLMVGTSGASSPDQKANLSVLTRQTASYSASNLTGIWEGSSLAAGPQAPWWQSGLLTINGDGTCSLSSTSSAGTSQSQNGTVSISTSGTITLNLGLQETGFVDPNLDVMVLTGTWPDGATQEITVFTNASAASLGTATNATWSTGYPTSSPTDGNYPGDYPGSSPVSGSSGLASPQSGFPSPSTAAPGSVSTPGTSAPQSSEPFHTAALPGPTTSPAAVHVSTASAPPPALPTTYRQQKPATVPGAPTIVAVAPGNSQALVNFKLPANDGGKPITGCSVVSNPGGITVTRPGSPITVSNLENGTTYTFTVKAENAVGTGPSSQISGSITPGAPPQAPRLLSVKALTGAAQVRFTAPVSNGGSNIILYTVTSNSGQKASGPSSPITVKGLSAGTPYTFTVTATNKTGTSSPSKPSQSVSPR